MLVTNDSTNGDEIAIDAKTVIYQGKFVRFWQRRLADVPNQNGVTNSFYYESVDCSQRVFRFHKDLYLDRAGKIVNQSVGDSPLQTVVPGSVGEQVYQLVCQSVDPNSVVTRAQLDALTRARQTNADMINKSMQDAAKLFH